MNHYERMFLLSRAHLLHKFTKEAEARGEQFHCSDSFVPLESGLEVQVRILETPDAPPILILRCRHYALHRKDAEIEQAVKGLFDEGCNRMKTCHRVDGYDEHVFYSEKIPKPVTPID